MKGDAAEKTHGGNGRRLLVVVEVALALMLLADRVLMIRSPSKLLAIDPGPTDATYSLRLTIPRGGLAMDSMPVLYRVALSTACPARCRRRGAE